MFPQRQRMLVVLGHAGHGPNNQKTRHRVANGSCENEACWIIQLLLNLWDLKEYRTGPYKLTGPDSTSLTRGLEPVRTKLLSYFNFTLQTNTFKKLKHYTPSHLIMFE